MSCPVEDWARARPQAPAIFFRGAAISYAALDVLVRDWEARLATLGTRRLVVPGESTPQTVALLHAAARAGVSVVLLNPRLTAPERAALEAAVQSPAADSSGGDLRAENASLPGDPVQLLLFTSGSTGRPKAAQLTVGSLRASAAASNAALGADAGSRFLCCLPLFHVGGVGLALRSALCGGALLLHERFDAAEVAAGLALSTHASFVATTLARVLDLRDDFRGAALRAVLVGGGPVPKPLLERALRAGLPVLQTYGLTEACSQVTCELPGEADGATAGVPLPGAQVRIVDGEIEVRGPMMMRGYLGLPPLDGWFRTGDLGELDSRGRLLVHARRNDLIVSGGENVYPAEVEAAIAGHPGVAEVAVVPAADERWGQVGCAFIVRRTTGWPVAADDASFFAELAAFLRPCLAGYKHPRRYLLLDELPRGASGKVDRLRLRALLSEQDR